MPKDTKSPRDDLTYDDARSAQLERLTTTRIVGVPLQKGSRDSLMRWILHCFCVQDSPDNPCVCDGPIIGIPNDALLRETSSRRRDEQGRELAEFVIRRDARLIVDSPRAVRADVYTALTNRRVGGQKPPSMLQKGSPAAGNAWLAWFAAFFAATTYIDGVTGGAISDAGAEVIEDVVDAATEPLDSLVPPS
jgi:hypothetical protein